MKRKSKNKINLKDAILTIGDNHILLTYNSKAKYDKFHTITYIVANINILFRYFKANDV